MRKSAPALAALGLAFSFACSGGGQQPVDVDAATDGDVPIVDATDAPLVDGPTIDGTEDISCGTGTNVYPLPASGMATGMASSTTPGNVQSTTCLGRGAETAYRFTVDHNVTLVATTVGAGTTLDTVLYVRRDCQLPATELGCNDDTTATETASTISIDLTPGSYYLIVDGRNVGSAGNYTLTTHFYEGVGQPCTTPAMCAPGYTCRAIPPSTQTTCERHVCDDGRDDDGDGRIDYPNDPGCVDRLDDTETDACPSGPGCPVCSNGLDDDSDGTTDYPADPGCDAASSGSEEDCGPEDDPLGLISAGTTTGTTAGAMNDFTPACAGMSSAADRVHLLHVNKPLAQLVVDTNGTAFDTVLSVYNALCATSLACDDDSGTGNQSLLALSNVAAGTYAIVVDGFGTAGGAYTLHVAGTYPAGGACDPAQPYFACPSGSLCTGPAGAETCAAAACNDTVDADGDGRPGYPSDPGCASPSDNDETDDCPSGPGCPACGNGLDDDGDGAIDFPMDTGCAAASSASESCVSVDALRVFTGNVTGQSTAGLANDVDLTCGLDGRDEVWRLTVPLPLADLRADTLGSPLDTVLAIKRSGCAATDLACDDNSGGNGDSVVTLANLTAGDYFLVVDDRGLTGGTYNLNVSGHYPNGGACSPTSPLFRCQTGYACSGATPTCVLAACNDTIDADGDGRPGFPSDPGCTSIDDNDELDACPSGPGCPACGNGLDDDGDGLTDFPMDTGCTSASAASEQACSAETDLITPVTGPITTGTTIGATNNFTPSCQTNSTGDRVHLLTLAVPVASLTLNTEGSTLTDPILMFTTATCALPPIACDDDSGTATQAQIIRTNVAAGTYAIVVDTYGTAAPNAYTLNVRGTLAAGASCNDPLVAAGVLACPTGTTCQANVCSP